MTRVKLNLSLSNVSAVTAHKGAKSIRAGVAKHRPFSEVIRQHRDGRPDRASHHIASDARGQGIRRGDDQASLQRSSGPQVEQVEQIRRASNEPAREHSLNRPAAQHRACNKAGAADARNFEPSTGQLASTQCCEMTLESFGIRCPDEIVVGTQDTSGKPRDCGC